MCLAVDYAIEYRRTEQWWTKCCERRDFKKIIVKFEIMEDYRLLFFLLIVDQPGPGF